MKLEVIRDILGQPYIAIVFSTSRHNNDFIESYLDRLKQYILRIKYNSIETYNKLLENKEKRDGVGHWHITVFNSMECKKNPKLLEYNGYEINTPNICYGIGTIFKEDKQTFYLVIDNNEIDQLLELNNLKKKNLHITLGFEPKDLFHYPKMRSTLIIEE